MTQNDMEKSAAPILIRFGLPSLAYFAAQVLAFRFPDSFGLIAAIWPAAGIGVPATHYALLPGRPSNPWPPSALTSWKVARMRTLVSPA